MKAMGQIDALRLMLKDSAFKAQRENRQPPTRVSSKEAAAKCDTLRTTSVVAMSCLLPIVPWRAFGKREIPCGFVQAKLAGGRSPPIEPDCCPPTSRSPRPGRSTPNARSSLALRKDALRRACPPNPSQSSPDSQGARSDKIVVDENHTSCDNVGASL